jgi:hypothetical protein
MSEIYSIVLPHGTLHSHALFPKPETSSIQKPQPYLDTFLMKPETSKPFRNTQVSSSIACTFLLVKKATYNRGKVTKRQN